MRGPGGFFPCLGFVATTGENKTWQRRSRAGGSATVPDDARSILNRRLRPVSAAARTRMGDRVLSPSSHRGTAIQRRAGRRGTKEGRPVDLLHASSRRSSTATPAPPAGLESLESGIAGSPARRSLRRGLQLGVGLDGQIEAPRDLLAAGHEGHRSLDLGLAAGRDDAALLMVEVDGAVGGFDLEVALGHLERRWRVGVHLVLDVRRLGR